MTVVAPASSVTIGGNATNTVTPATGDALGSPGQATQSDQPKDFSLKLTDGANDLPGSLTEKCRHDAFEQHWRDIALKGRSDAQRHNIRPDPDETVEFAEHNRRFRIGP
jgi:hypothetical protein